MYAQDTEKLRHVKQDVWIEQQNMEQYEHQVRRRKAELKVLDVQKAEADFVRVHTSYIHCCWCMV